MIYEINENKWEKKKSTQTHLFQLFQDTFKRLIRCVLEHLFVLISNFWFQLKECNVSI